MKIKIPKIISHYSAGNKAKIFYHYLKIYKRFVLVKFSESKIDDNKIISIILQLNSLTLWYKFLQIDILYANIFFYH